MTPRIKPRAELVRDARRQALDRGAAPRPRDEDSDALFQQALAADQADPGVSPEPYGPGSRHSFFVDQLWASGHEALRGATPPPPVGSVQAASARLRVARGPYREARDLTTSATAGGGSVP